MVGPAGIEPTTFTQNRYVLSLRVSPRSRISSSQSMVSKPLHISGALNGLTVYRYYCRHPFLALNLYDRAWLDYGPSSNNKLQIPNIYVS